MKRSITIAYTLVLYAVICCCGFTKLAAQQLTFSEGEISVTYKEATKLRKVAYLYGVKVADLRKLNTLGEDVKQVQAGVKLVLPIKKSKYKFEVDVVEVGDSVMKFSRKYPSAYSYDVRKINGLALNDKLKVGRRLLIPNSPRKLELQAAKKREAERLAEIQQQLKEKRLAEIKKKRIAALERMRQRDNSRKVPQKVPQKTPHQDTKERKESVGKFNFLNSWIANMTGFTPEEIRLLMRAYELSGGEFIYVCGRTQVVSYFRNGKIVSHQCSTGKNGFGSKLDSGKTPVGIFEVGIGLPYKENLFLNKGERVTKKKDPAVFKDPRCGGKGAYVCHGFIALMKCVYGKNKNIGKRSIGLHGTNRENDLGSRASGGCVRVTKEALKLAQDLFFTNSDGKLLKKKRVLMLITGEKS